MINLPGHIGFNVRNSIEIYRRKNNIPEPEEVRKIYNKNMQFIEEELTYIDKLIIDSDILPYLKYFPNVKEIILNGDRSINQKQFDEIINMYPNIKSLTIVDQKVSYIDVSNLKELEVLNLNSNRDLVRITGLEKLNKIKKISIFGNQSLNVNSINTLINQTYKYIKELGSKCEYDVLYIHDFMNYINSKGISLDSLKDSLTWAEHEKSGVEMRMNDITYTTDELLKGYNKALDVVYKYIDEEDTLEQKYAILYQWMCENVVYDRSIYDPKVERDTKLTNGSVNGLVNGKCVCQGYTKAMQLLLKVCGIYSDDILCRTKDEENSKKTFLGIYDGSKHADDTNHSILKVYLGRNTCYSDVTWDAGRYQRGKEREYFLLSQDDMSKDHKMYYEQDIVDIYRTVPREEQDRLLKFASERIKTVDMRKAR